MRLTEDGSVLSNEHSPLICLRILNKRFIAITGQSVPIFIQLVWSFLISARILMRRLDSRRSRLRALPFVSDRRNISMRC